MNGITCYGRYAGVFLAEKEFLPKQENKTAAKDPSRPPFSPLSSVNAVVEVLLGGWSVQGCIH